MSTQGLTGSRIREKRVALGIRQADLAKKAGISASYLNLIEHNRRRIGGKLLLDIAAILEVEPTILSEGAGAALIASLREVASGMEAEPELDRVDEFAGRFPGWAGLLAQCGTRIFALERMVETLSDRMTHDPHLATSLHEMLTNVTAIHSASAILSEPEDVSPQWQARFHRNIHEDSARLADAARGLAAYLDKEGDETHHAGTPYEEFDKALNAAAHHIPECETVQDPGAALERLGTGLSSPARALLKNWLERYAADAGKLPLPRLEKALRNTGVDTAELAQTLDAPPALIMRRLATLPDGILSETIGLAVCDASGVLRYRKPLPDFPMPRFGAACPLWPLYQALNRPGVLLSRSVIHPGQAGTGLWAEAVAEPRSLAHNDAAQYDAYMLLRRHPGNASPPPQPVGVACRICPRESCNGRSEPSILGGS